MDDKYTFEYFTSEFNLFWKALGNRNTTVEQAFLAFKGLSYVALRVEENRQKVDTMLSAALTHLSYVWPYLDEAKQ